MKKRLFSAASFLLAPFRFVVTRYAEHGWLAAVKTNYAERVADEELAAILKCLIKSQKFDIFPSICVSLSNIKEKEN